MPGSVDDPVRFGNPFQRIVEVGWSSKYFAARLDLGMTATPAGETDTGPGPEFVEPFTFAFLSSVSFFFNEGAMKSPKVLTGGQWFAIEADEVEFSGEPGAPTGNSFGAWEYAGVASSGVVGPFHRYSPESEGAGIDVTVPDSSLQFTSGLSVAVDVRANPLTEDGPFAAPFSGTVPKWKTAVDVSSLEELVTVQSESLSATGMTLTYRDKTYQAIGSKCLPGAGLERGEFWVLFEKVPA